MIYWTPISGSYFLKGSILEKCGKFWKNGRFSGRIWPDWGNTTRTDMAGVGSIGLYNVIIVFISTYETVSVYVRNKNRQPTRKPRLTALSTY